MSRPLRKHFRISRIIVSSRFFGVWRSVIKYSDISLSNSSINHEAKGQSALGHILQHWWTDVWIISCRATCGRTISVGQTFGRARQTSKVPTACLWGARLSNKGPIHTRLYFVFVSWIVQQIHETKTKYGPVRIDPETMERVLILRSNTCIN